MLTRTHTRLPEMLRSDDDFNTLFRRVMNMPWLGYTETGAWKPAVDLVDSAEEYVLTAELPGIDPKDVDISIEENVLYIRGEKREEYEEKEPKYHLFERVYGNFERTFTLPPSIEADKIRAEFKNGVVKVHMPKTKKATGRKIALEAMK